METGSVSDGPERHQTASDGLEGHGGTCVRAQPPRCMGIRVPIKHESRIFLTALSEILRGDEKTTYAKFECNRRIFRGGASRFYVTIGLT